jgi:2-polyprenyl-3-methyl-5-hydroxy-6-metoxy-1,4-benzoquinol methylase
LKNISVLEIGCSSGGTISTLKPFVKSVHGCDLDVHAITFAKERLDVDVEVNMQPSILPEGRKLFIMSDVLEHAYNPLETIKKIRALMSDGGYFFVAVPGLNEVAEGDCKNDLRRYFHMAHATDFTAYTLKAMSQEASFDDVFINEDVHALFVAAKKTVWKRNENDSIDNIRRIEKTYSGVFPHL